MGRNHNNREKVGRRPRANRVHLVFFWKVCYTGTEYKPLTAPAGRRVQERLCWDT